MEKSANKQVSQLSSSHHTIGMLLGGCIEGKWLVDRFDWQITQPTAGQVYNVECADISHDLDWFAATGGKPYTCMPITCELKAA